MYDRIIYLRHICFDAVNELLRTLQLDLDHVEADEVLAVFRDLKTVIEGNDE